MSSLALLSVELEHKRKTRLVVINEDWDYYLCPRPKRRSQKFTTFSIFISNLFINLFFSSIMVKSVSTVTNANSTAGGDERRV